MPTAPNPNAAGLVPGAPSQPQDNSAASQIKRVMSMLGTLPISQINTPEEQEMAMTMAEQMELVAAQLRQQASKKGDINFTPNQGAAQ